MHLAYLVIASQQKSRIHDGEQTIPKILTTNDDESLRTATTGSGKEPSTPQTIKRLRRILQTTVGTPAGEAPTPASTVAGETDGHGVSGSSVVDSPVRTSSDLPVDEAADGVADGRAAQRDLVFQVDYSAVEATLRDSVREAQGKAETELAELVDRIREAEAARHEAELERVTNASQKRQEQAVAETRKAVEAEAARARDEIESCHADELRSVRDNAKVEVAAAVEAALKDRARQHADEIARMQAELEAQHLDSLQRVNDAVMESIEALTARMTQLSA